MHPLARNRTVLVVEDDAALLGVLSRVLTRAGYRVLQAGTVHEALQQVSSAPAAALLDLVLPDGTGVDLARRLQAHWPGLPAILMTACPHLLAEHPDFAGPFARVLAKPMDLDELLRSLDAVLTEDAMSESPVHANSEPKAPAASPGDHPGHTAALPEVKHVASPFFKIMQSAALVLLFGVVLLGFLGFVVGVPIPGFHHQAKAVGSEGRSAPTLGVRLAEGRRHTLLIPEEVRVALGIRKEGRDESAVVKAPTDTRPLVLYGNTALDPTNLMRIRARFAPAEVVTIGQVPDPVRRTDKGESVLRELRPGDRVKKGDVLGVFFSVDVGSKKNDLLDALVQLELDQKILDNAEKHSESVPEAFLLQYRRNVQGDRNAISRALNNLIVWNIPQEEIDALHEEAKKITASKDAWFKTREGRWVRGEKGKSGRPIDLIDRENDNPWGKVTLRAPFDGVIVERNIVRHEIVQDPTTCLFQIAKVGRLLVIANAPEDELPHLNALMNSPDLDDRQWSVRTVGPVPVTGLRGPIEEIGYLIDPNQHTAVIKGFINNPREQVRAGQFVSATVRIPAPKDVVEVPINAVVEDGKNSVVFVQTDPVKHYYTMRRVQVTHRFEKTVFVRSKDFDISFTGTTAEDSRVVSGLSDMAGLATGQAVVGPGIAAGTTITKVGARTLTLSQAATASAKGVSLKAVNQLSAEEKEQGMLPLEPLRPGERILKTGVGELKAALIDLESRPARDPAEAKGS